MSDLGLVCSIKYRMPSAWLSGCFHLETYSASTLFHWDDNLDRLFEESKTVIATEIANGVKIFDKTKAEALFVFINRPLLLPIWTENHLGG